MQHLCLAVADISYFSFVLPLVVAVSLVYAATRHERMGPILIHAVRFGLWVVGFMAVLFVILLFISWWV
ncbi:MAG TPA: hypothetical protein EYP56_01960 [Planctomycetaceae bacterium]|nr:hypothetical protein [Planctomycetaceae bacterium]